ncbi:MAG: major capsid protein [Thermodesulfobacteriota bacterium]|nr:major capsid protein [Thermodesulfobacteriota bacterium]
MINLASLFTKEAIVRYLKSLPVLKTPVMDTIFTDRPLHPLPVVGADMITEVAHALPVVRRGSPSIAAGSDAGEFAFYEPLPVRPHKMVTGQDLNNLKILNGGGKDAWAQGKTDLLRRIVRRTTEGLCAASLSGSFTWPIQLESGGFETWSIDFGSPESVTPSKLLDESGAALKDIYVICQAMEEALEENGYGSTNEIWAGKSAYEQIFTIAEASKTTAKIRVELTDEGINVGGYLIKRRAEKIRNPETKAMTPVVPLKDMMMIATDAGHKMPYCAVDDLEANLQAMPLFIKPIVMKDPSGYKLVGESKPFPIPNVKGICTATVLS